MNQEDIRMECLRQALATLSGQGDPQAVVKAAALYERYVSALPEGQDGQASPE